MIIQVSLKNSNFFYKYVLVYYYKMYYYYLKLNFVKKKKLYKFILGCGFFSCDSDYENIDFVLYVYVQIFFFYFQMLFRMI